MNVKERMISLKLLKEKKDHSEFLEEIGVAATVRVNCSKKEPMRKSMIMQKSDIYVPICRD